MEKGNMKNRMHFLQFSIFQKTGQVCNAISIEVNDSLPRMSKLLSLNQNL